MNRRLNTTASAVNTTWNIAQGTSFAEMLVVKDQLESFSLVCSLAIELKKTCIRFASIHCENCRDIGNQIESNLHLRPTLVSAHLP